MRNALALILASVLTAVVVSAVWFFTASPRLEAPSTIAAPQPERLVTTASAKPAPAREEVEITAAIPAKPAASPQPKTACANPDALGVARVVVIDTTGGPGFGFEHFKQLDFLADKEVVLTFDDGPWPGNTPAVLKAL
jgi:peptidoglycan-N-acetylglucosamine deacetylase